MVAQNTFRTYKGKQILKKNTIAIAFYLNKCFKQIKLPIALCKRSPQFLSYNLINLSYDGGGGSKCFLFLNFVLSKGYCLILDYYQTCQNFQHQRTL